MILKEPGAQPKMIQSKGGLPFWSPDGKLIVSNADANTLQVIDMNGTVEFSVDGATSDSLSWQAIHSGG